MATQTFILRPDSIGAASDELSSAMTIYPADTVPEDAYILVSEKTADDDATYIAPKETLFPVWFGFTEPVGYEGVVPKACRVFCCTKSSTAEKNLNIQYMILKENPNTGITASQESLYEHTFTETNTYTSLEISIDETVIASIWEFFDYRKLNIDTFAQDYMRSAWFGISKSSGGGKNHDTRVTQFYIELDYEVEESTEPLLYIKESDTWVPISGTAYKKVNGVWVASNMDSLSANESIIVKEVN